MPPSYLHTDMRWNQYDFPDHRISIEEDDVKLKREPDVSPVYNEPARTLSTRSVQTVTQEVQPLTSSEKDALDKWKEILSQFTHQYEAIFVLGPMCSGKTNAISDIRNTAVGSNLAYVDTDGVMEALDGYHQTKIEQFYPKARRVVKHLTDWLLNERRSFIVEGTCVKYEELMNFMVRLKERGYTIKVMKLDGVSLDTVLERAAKRVIRTVSPEIIERIYVNSLQGLKRLYEFNKNRFLFEELYRI